MRLTLLPALALLPSAFGQLNKLTKAKGKTYFGSATDNGELSDTQYVAILDDINEFGQITPGNTMKWQYAEPTQNTFDFSGGDLIANLAKTKGQLLRCHTLVWHSQLPSWVTSGTWTNATLIAAMKNHIANEVTHYKGQCYAWDVVNEALNDDGTYRSSPFYDTIGPEFIPIAFMTAAQYDPTVKLYYNDYNLEYGSAKATAAQNIVKGLKARGIKIDGVGLQAHMIVGSTPSLSSMTTVLNSFTTLGVEVAYTELDIRHSTLPPTDAALAQQSTDYVSMVGSCIQTTGCVGVTIWDFTDKYSWIPSVFSGQGQACLWNADFTKKPAYTAVVSLLGGGSATTSSSSSKPSSTSSTKTTLTTSTIKTTSTTKTTSTSKTSTTSAAPTGGTIAKWGQCAGQTWTGSGTCVAGTTCTYSNPWYSQCL